MRYVRTYTCLVNIDGSTATVATIKRKRALLVSFRRADVIVTETDERQRVRKAMLCVQLLFTQRV